ncbi:MAG: DUF2911 domain-containing protein [Bryobacteraceae bacterium]
MKIISYIAAGAAAVAMLSAATGHRKVTENKLSPTAETSITLAGKTVTIEYNAPSARERKVEGGLIPFDSVWRLGADSATTLTTDTDLMIGDLKVPKGVYTLYLQGGATDWKLVVNKQTGQWGTEYDASKDLGRVEMKVSKTLAFTETLKIALRNPGVLDITWGNSRAAVPVKAA